jgi:hypothetical protein
MRFDERALDRFTLETFDDVVSRYARIHLYNCMVLGAVRFEITDTNNLRSFYHVLSQQREKL